MTYRLTQDAHGWPVLCTGRLRLRRPADHDLARATRFWASERSHMMGGPRAPDETCEELIDVLDQWQRQGFGVFTVTLEGSDEGIGAIGPHYPEGHPEPEFGWSLWDAGHEGKGLAYEAATAARDWFFATTGFRTAVSYTDPANTRSHRLCARMGATFDRAAVYPFGEEPKLAFRHHAGGCP